MAEQDMTNQRDDGNSALEDTHTDTTMTITGVEYAFLATTANWTCHRATVLRSETTDNLQHPTIKCESCVLAKMLEVPNPNTHSRMLKPGECWVSDTNGPTRTVSVGGCKYYTLYLDAASALCNMPMPPRNS